MRILHVAEAHAVHTDRIARHQIRAGHEVAVATWHNLVGSGPVHSFGTSDLVRRLPYHHHWTRIGSFARFAHDFRPEIVHGHYLSTAALYLAVASGHPTVASAMGSDVLLDTRALHARLLLRALPRWTDCFTSVAPHITRRMVELGIPVDRIATFPWGVDRALFHPPDDLGPSPLLVSTRNFESSYGIPDLVEAFARLRASRSDARLRLFGDGSLRPSIAARIRGLGLDRVVSLEGHVPQRRLADALRDAALYVSTAVSDGASVSLLEAMSTGLIPVVTDIEANRAWIDDGRNGLLYSSGDAAGLAAVLERALSDDALRARCFRENPRIVESRGAWDRSMKRLDAVYRGAVGG